jgi:hypothetical protein
LGLAQARSKIFYKGEKDGFAYFKDTP